MGYLKEKYTKTYYLHKDEHNQEVGYGALGVEEWKSGGLRDDLKETLDLVSFAGKDILEIGYGRGESARYLIGTKKAQSYIGVDFSESAFNLARETLKPFLGSCCKLYCDDALEFLKKQSYDYCIDAILLIDAIEHIPTYEVAELFPLFFRALRFKGHIIVYTPYYPVDEDFIAQDCQYIEPSATDLIPETRGMHCNKFTRERLIREFHENGFDFVQDRVFIKSSLPAPFNANKRATVLSHSA